MDKKHEIDEGYVGKRAKTLSKLIEIRGGNDSLWNAKHVEMCMVTEEMTRYIP